MKKIWVVSKLAFFINFSCKSRTTASTIYENANFETTHSLFKIPVDLDDDNEDEKDIQNGLNEDDGNKQRIDLLNNTSYNISFKWSSQKKKKNNIEQIDKHRTIKLLIKQFKLKFC